MLETYRSDSPVVAARQIEVEDYTVVSEVTMLGWEIQVAISQKRPLILFHAVDWEGRRPRFAVTPLHIDHFRKVLQDLASLPLQQRDQLLTLTNKEPVCIIGGLVEIPKGDRELQQLWTKIIGKDFA